MHLHGSVSKVHKEVQWEGKFWAWMVLWGNLLSWTKGCPGHESLSVLTWLSAHTHIPLYCLSDPDCRAGHLFPLLSHLLRSSSGNTDQLYAQYQEKRMKWGKAPKQERGTIKADIEVDRAYQADCQAQLAFGFARGAYQNALDDVAAYRRWPGMGCGGVARRYKGEGTGHSDQPWTSVRLRGLM